MRGWDEAKPPLFVPLSPEAGERGEELGKARTPELFANIELKTLRLS